MMKNNDQLVPLVLHPENITVPEPDLAEAKRRVSIRGHTPSGGSWEDEETICAFSVQTHGPATYNHPKCTIMYDKKRKVWS